MKSLFSLIFKSVGDYVYYDELDVGDVFEGTYGKRTVLYRGNVTVALEGDEKNTMYWAGRWQYYKVKLVEQKIVSHQQQYKAERFLIRLFGKDHI